MIVLCSGCDAGQQVRLLARHEEAFKEPKQVELAYAAQAGDVERIDRLVAEGATVKAIGERNATVLWYALYASMSGAFERLLELGANPNAVSESGEPLIGYCIMTKEAAFLKVALKYGGNPNAVNRTIKQPIVFRAVNDQYLDKLVIMLDAGADVNVQRADGSTPVVYAASSRQVQAVLLLLRRGADPLLRNSADMDIAAGIFGPRWDDKSENYKVREEILRFLQARGFAFEWPVIEAARIRNLAEATGKEPPMWLKGRDKEPNPEWVRANPEKAEKWYQQVLGRPAPTR